VDSLIPAFLRRQRNQRRLTLEMLSARVGMSRQPWPNGWSDQMRVLAPPV
jgi:hypothetical protein